MDLNDKLDTSTHSRELFDFIESESLNAIGLSNSPSSTTKSINSSTNASTDTTDSDPYTCKNRWQIHTRRIQILSSVAVKGKVYRDQLKIKNCGFRWENIPDNISKLTLSLDNYNFKPFTEIQLSFSAKKIVGSLDTAVIDQLVKYLNFDDLSRLPFPSLYKKIMQKLEKRQKMKSKIQKSTIGKHAKDKQQHPVNLTNDKQIDHKFDLDIFIEGVLDDIFIENKISQQNGSINSVNKSDGKNDSELKVIVYGKVDKAEFQLSYNGIKSIEYKAECQRGLFQFAPERINFYFVNEKLELLGSSIGKYNERDVVTRFYNNNITQRFWWEITHGYDVNNTHESIIDQENKQLSKFVTDARQVLLSDHEDHPWWCIDGFKVEQLSNHVLCLAVELQTNKYSSNSKSIGILRIEVDFDTYPLAAPKCFVVNSNSNSSDNNDIHFNRCTLINNKTGEISLFNSKWSSGMTFVDVIDFSHRLLVDVLIHGKNGDDILCKLSHYIDRCNSIDSIDTNTMKIYLLNHSLPICKCSLSMNQLLARKFYINKRTGIQQNPYIICDLCDKSVL